jgi:AAA domain-containing protein/DnaB helicase-like protein
MPQRPQPDPAPEETLWSAGAEHHVLGAVLYDPDILPELQRSLRPEHFYLVAHRALYQAAIYEHSEGRHPNQITIAGRAIDSGQPPAEVYRVLGPIAAVIPGARESVLASSARLRELWLRRRLQALGRLGAARAAEANGNLGEMAAAQIEDLRDIMRDSGSCGSRLLVASRLGVDFLSVIYPEPAELIPGVLAGGDLAVLYGKPYTGKTWLALTMAVAIVCGKPWAGFNAGSQARVGLLELELAAPVLQRRIAAVSGGIAGLSVICRPDLKGGFNLGKSDDMQSLENWVRETGQQLCILDSLSKSHQADESNAQEIGEILGNLDVLGHDTGCCTMPLHHEPKGDGKTERDDIDCLRGSGRLASDPVVLIRAVKKAGGIELRFPKVASAKQPKPRFFRLSDDGVPELAEAPEEVGERNRARVLTALERLGTASRRQLEIETKFSPRTVKEHLAALVEAKRIAVNGSGCNTSYASVHSVQADEFAPNKLL